MLNLLIWSILITAEKGVKRVRDCVCVCMMGPVIIMNYETEYDPFFIYFSTHLSPQANSNEEASNDLI